MLVAGNGIFDSLVLLVVNKLNLLQFCFELKQFQNRYPEAEEKGTKVVLRFVQKGRQVSK